LDDLVDDHQKKALTLPRKVRGAKIRTCHLGSVTVYVGATGDRKLSGKGAISAFVEGCRATNVPPSWFDRIEVVGPLAEFEGADQWVSSPAKPGLALIADAAGATDPSWGCGLAKTLIDAETLAKCLAETDDWNAALERYAAAHDDYGGKNFQT
jgi:2-polyprenyl-6-methoxyphenol hydroxylase-like FAD-dependent oxidoreductase